MDYFHKFDALITPSLGSVKPLRRSSEGDSSQSYENCDWKEPHTLQHYYENMESADNPFREIRMMGTKGTQWKWTGIAGVPGNLKLIHNNVLAKSGAVHLKVKSGYAVKLRITVGEEDFILGKKSQAPVVRLDSNPQHGLIRKDVNYTTSRIEYEWPIVRHDDAPPNGKELVEVVLVGDCGDYLSMDLEGQWDGIAKFRLKLCENLYRNIGIEDINGNSYVEVLGVCQIDETSASGQKTKIEDYEGYTIWRDDTSAPFKIQAKNSFGLVVKTQEYATYGESWGAINLIKVWIDGQVESQNGGGGGGGGDGGGGGGGDGGGGDDGGGDGNGNGDDGDNSGCPENSTLNQTGQCVCDSGFKLDAATQSCKAVESEGFSSYLVIGAVALLGLVMLG